MDKYDILINESIELLDESAGKNGLYERYQSEKYKNRAAQDQAAIDTLEKRKEGIKSKHKLANIDSMEKIFRSSKNINLMNAKRYENDLKHKGEISKKHDLKMVQGANENKIIRMEAIMRDKKKKAVNESTEYIELMDDINYLYECIQDELTELTRITLYEATENLPAIAKEAESAADKKRKISIEKIINYIKNICIRIWEWVQTIFKKTIAYFKTIPNKEAVADSDITVCSEALTGIPHTVFSSVSSIIEKMINPFSDTDKVEEIMDEADELFKHEIITIKKGQEIDLNKIIGNMEYINAEISKSNKKLGRINTMQGKAASNNEVLTYFQNAKTFINKYQNYLYKVVNDCKVIEDEVTKVITIKPKDIIDRKESK